MQCVDNRALRMLLVTFLGAMVGACSGEVRPTSQQGAAPAVGDGDAAPAPGDGDLPQGDGDLQQGGSQQGDGGLQQGDGNLQQGDGDLPQGDGGESSAAPVDAGTPGNTIGADAGILREPIASGPPFMRPDLPVRRLAMTDAELCVVLQDQTLHCVDRPLSNQPTDLTTFVEDNQGYVAVTLAELDRDHFYGFHADGTVDMWVLRNRLTDDTQTLSNTLRAFGDPRHYCALQSDGVLHCTGTTSPAAAGEGPFVDFEGSVAQGSYRGLQTDGRLVGVAPYFEGRTLVAMHSRELRVDTCGLTIDDELYCLEYPVGQTEAVEKLYFTGPLRDFVATGSHVCAVLESGAASCLERVGQPSPSSVPQDLRFVDIESAGDDATCGTTEQGQVHCWNDTGTVYQVPLPLPAAVR